MAGNLTAMIAAIFSGSAVSTDPYFNLTTLLLSTTATNGQQNNTFQDSSTNNFTITRNPATGPNAPTQGTFSPFSQTGWGNYFSAANASLSVPDNAKYYVGANNFTIEVFSYHTAWPSNHAMVFEKGPYASGREVRAYINATQVIFEVNVSGSATGTYTNITATTTNSLNTWYHWAFVRSGNTLYIFRDGSLLTSGAVTGTVVDTTQSMTIGGPGDGNSGFTMFGYISNFRIITGQAVATSTFTPPTSPLTTSSTGWTVSGSPVALTGTVGLLTCQSNRFIDTSASPLTITPGAGLPQVVAFSPFNPTSAWSASTVGGSGYFSGSYLTVPAGADFNLGTNDFCIEFWLNPIAPATYGGILSFDSSGDYPLNFSYASANSSNVQANFGTTTAWLYTAFFDTSTTTNAWAHYVATRSGSTFRLFKNGVLKATGTSSGTIGNSSGNIYINGNSSSAGTTYISNLRIINGSIPTDYQTSSTTTGTTIFTVPTSPLTTTSQGATASDVKLLLNCTNSGIYDATAKNVLETVGNAQVSNTTSQWPSTSMSFNGTTDYLQVNTASDLYNLVSGNWTIEAWVYRTSTANNKSGIITFLDNASPSLSGWAFDCGGSNAGQLGFYTYNLGTLGTNVSSSAGAVPINTWTYVAATCVGSTITIYINGTSVASGTKGGWSTNANCRLRIGGWNYSVALRYWQGYIQDPRITKGVARTITTPTAAFPVQ
jgi:hypothetical protein